MSSPIQLFIIEDNNKLREMLAEYFQAQNFSVTSIPNGNQACEQILEAQPDIVLLDLMLPGCDGLTICRQIRTQYEGKILMLTASDDDFDHVAALEVGADDFVVKPIKPRVLLARMRMLLRRESSNKPSEHTNTTLVYGGLKLIPSRYQCELNGQPVPLSDSEFDLLCLLASHPDEVLNRDVLTQSLRGISYDGLDRTIDNKIVTLRKKLADDAGNPRRIITVRGKGYLFVPDAW